MGVHAFENEPEHCGVYREQSDGELPLIFGVDERWNMPVARHRRKLGPGTEFRGVGHFTLTYHIGGSAAERQDGPVSGKARRGALSLQRPFSSGRFATSGVVEYAHYYFSQSFVTEVAEDIGVAPKVTDDFFALHDETLARDAEAYLLRAGDPHDPPEPMEMDGRACFVVAGVLRLLNKSQALRNGLRDGDRGGLQKVIKSIEARLGEPLRLSDLAAVANMSSFHLSRVFKDAFGETVWQYVKRRRTETAIDLIRRTTDLGFSEIAFRTGFAHQSHMSRHVKKLTGKTPGQIRSKR